MKNIKIVAVCAIGMLFCSCNADLLDIKNKNSLSTGVFWSSPDDVESGLVAVYGMFYRQGTWTRNMYTQMHGMADEGVSYAGWTELKEYTQFLYTNYNFDESNVKIWREHYVAIYRANQVLDNIETITFTNQKQKEDIIGQTKFLRSLYYFYLTVLWDDVPLVLKTSSASDQPEQKTSDQIWTQIEADLEEAILLLPETRDQNNYGRVTKGSAYGLLARIYAQHKKWGDAERCLRWIIEEGGKAHYDLVTNYGDNFSQTTEDNKESLYEIHFSLTNRVGFDQTNNPFDPNAQLGSQIEINQSPTGIGWNNIESRRWLVDYYKRERTTDGKNDPRLYYTLWYDNAATDFPEFTKHSIYGNSWDSGWSNRCFIKKYSTDVVPIYYWNDNNFRLIRLADMILLYAEVLNENEGPTAKAVAQVNRVRTRAGLPELKDSKYYKIAEITADKNAFRDHVKVERALETAFECIRWIDTKRWGINDQTALTEYKARDTDYNNFIIGKSIRMPIPQSEVDNNPNLDQISY